MKATLTVTIEMEKGHSRVAPVEQLGRTLRELANRLTTRASRGQTLDGFQPTMTQQNGVATNVTITTEETA